MSAIQLGISVIDQCSTTLNQEFKCQNCPNLTTNGISFGSTSVITLECLNSETIVSQLNAVVSDYLLSEAKKDISLGFPDDSFSEYLRGTQTLAIEISQMLINQGKDYISSGGLYCTDFDKVKRFFSVIPQLNNNLRNTVAKDISEGNVFRDLITLVSSTNVTQTVSRFFLIFSLTALLLLIIAIMLIVIGFPCGYITIIILVIFLIFLITANLI